MVLEVEGDDDEDHIMMFTDVVRYGLKDMHEQFANVMQDPEEGDIFVSRTNVVIYINNM